MTTTDAKGNKAVTGGIMKRQGLQTKRFRLKSVQEYSAKVERLGGKVAPKMPIPGMGYIVMCADTENNGFGIFELTLSSSAVIALAVVTGSVKRCCQTPG